MQRLGPQRFTNLGRQCCTSVRLQKLWFKKRTFYDYQKRNQMFNYSGKTSIRGKGTIQYDKLYEYMSHERFFHSKMHGSPQDLLQGIGHDMQSTMTNWYLVLFSFLFHSKRDFRKFKSWNVLFDVSHFSFSFSNKASRCKLEAVLIKL